MSVLFPASRGTAMTTNDRRARATARSASAMSRDIVRFATRSSRPSRLSTAAMLVSRLLRRRRFILTVALGALALGLALLVGPPLALVHRQDLPLERAYGDAAVSVVSRILGGDAVNPRAKDPRALAAGRAAYTGSCGVCHGAKGDGRGAFGPSTYPDATDFTTAAAKSKTDAQLFWIVKNGLGFTAMPAFGGQYTDAEIWAMVAYLRA